MTFGGWESLLDTTVHPPVAGGADEGSLEAGLMKEMRVKTVRNKQVALEKRQLGGKGSS